MLRNRTQDRWNWRTRLLHRGEDPRRYFGAVVPPIVETSLFAFDSYEAIEAAFADKRRHFVYTRGQNPTIDLTAAKIADLEGGEEARLFSSGMAAISATILAQVSQGDHIVCVKGAYGPTLTFLTTWLSRFGVTATLVDGRDSREFEAAAGPRTKVFYLESPSSLTFTLQDLRAVADIARRRGIVTIIDNSWATPVFQRPLEMGIDLVVHSATKYLAGHSDLLAGAVVGGREQVDRIADQEHALLGGVIGPFEAWLLLRGLRTLDVRLKRHMENALRIARYLADHPKVAGVNYPGLPDYPQRDLAQRQMSGSSGLMSVLLDCDPQGVRRFVNNLSLFRLGVSWGGFESLVFAPIISAAREQPEERLQETGITQGLIRLAVGLEDADDLIADLEAALDAI